MKKGLIAVIVIVVIAVAAVLGIMIANANIPEMSEEDVMNEVLRQCEPQLQRMREQYDLPDLSLKLEPTEVRIRKPTVFQGGSISFEFSDYLVVPSLDTAEYNQELYDKFTQVWTGARFNYFHFYSEIGFTLEKYDRFFVGRDPKTEDELQFIDDQGNTYEFFDDYGVIGIRKNGECVFSDDSGMESYSAGGTSGGSKTCKKCGDSVSNLTAGGYCKTCVDIYYTDYYVDWDGEVSADRPW